MIFKLPTTKSSAVVAIAITTVASLSLTTFSIDSFSNVDTKRVIVLGIDGMDPQLLRQFIDEGRMPHFERLATIGSFSELQTTMPPLSPVAWSTFITGMDPGGHGVYDFLHRDPNTIEPFDSMAQVSGPGRSISVGSWVIPISGGEAVLQRKGRAFWELLEEAGVKTRDKNDPFH